MRRLTILLGISAAACGGDGGDVTAPPGSIEVTTQTIGPAPASYELLVDGSSQGAIGPSTTRSVSDVAAGEHTVGLSGLPANCQLQGTSPLEVTVRSGAAEPVTFVIICTPPPPETGTLAITTATTGTDPDGYLITVDGGTPQPIGIKN